MIIDVITVNFVVSLVTKSFIIEASKVVVRGGGGTPYNGLHGEAPPERGTFFRLQVYKRVGISQVEVYKRVGKSVIQVFKRAFNYNFE